MRRTATTFTMTSWSAHTCRPPKEVDEIEGMFDMGQKPSAKPVVCKFACLICLALFTNLVRAMQNPFSLMALAARSGTSFLWSQAVAELSRAPFRFVSPPSPSFRFSRWRRGGPPPHPRDSARGGVAGTDIPCARGPRRSQRERCRAAPPEHVGAGGGGGGTCHRRGHPLTAGPPAHRSMTGREWGHGRRRRARWNCARAVCRRTPLASLTAGGLRATSSQRAGGGTGVSCVVAAGMVTAVGMSNCSLAASAAPHGRLGSPACRATRMREPASRQRHPWVMSHDGSPAGERPSMELRRRTSSPSFPSAPLLSAVRASKFPRQRRRNPGDLAGVRQNDS
jgi:hypothetical protein